MDPPEMFAEFMKEEMIKSAKLNSLSAPFLSPKRETLGLHGDNGVIIGHSARPAARGISTLFLPHQQPMSYLTGSEQTLVLHASPPHPLTGPVWGLLSLPSASVLVHPMPCLQYPHSL